MRVAVIGTRTFNDYGLLEQLLVEINPSVIISGGAGGADQLAAKYANENKIELVEIKPNWKSGRHAGLLRNTQIVNSAEFLLALWDGKSKGTKDSIDKAVKQQLPVKIVLF
jgi:hypothetical protein